MIQKADIVRAAAGRDTGKLFFVLDVKDGYAYIADGKSRKCEKPKMKKLMHLRPAGQRACRVADKIRAGTKLTNSELRRELAEFASKIPGDEGGM